MEARIRLGQRIGRGGMAEVFAAQLIGPAGFEKDVAVKRLLPRFSHDAVFLERFLNEARLAARLSHPNIVQIFELGHDGNDHYIVMEAVRGKSLRAVLDRINERHERMPRGTALFVAQALCAGLAHAHEKFAVIHRDISPHNVLLSFDGGVKLIDFGIARAQATTTTTAARLTQVGQVIGKRRYMSPEQVSGDELDGRSDLFAVGILLFEMLAGTHPFASLDDPDDDEVSARMINGARRTLLQVVPDVDPAVAAVVERALAVAREERYASAREMDTALGAAMVNGGARDVEMMLKRLFEQEAGLRWPVDEVRTDGAERTATGGVAAPREITLASDITGPRTAEPDEFETAEQPELRAPQTRRTLLIAAFGLGSGALAAAGAAALWARRDDGAPATIARADAGLQVAALVDAGAASAPAAPDSGDGDVQDAGVLDDGAPDAGDHHEVPKAPRKPKKYGRLTIDTRPWTTVRLDGKKVGVTPLALDVALGKHRVLLENSDSGVRRELDIVVGAEEPAVLRLDLRK